MSKLEPRRQATVYEISPAKLSDSVALLEDFAEKKSVKFNKINLRKLVYNMVELNWSPDATFASLLKPASEESCQNSRLLEYPKEANINIP